MLLYRIPELHLGKWLFSIGAEPGFATKGAKGTVLAIGIGDLSRFALEAGTRRMSGI
jgi:hypothetical protein